MPQVKIGLSSILTEFLHWLGNLIDMAAVTNERLATHAKRREDLSKWQKKVAAPKILECVDWCGSANFHKPLNYDLQPACVRPTQLSRVVFAVHFSVAKVGGEGRHELWA